MCAVAKKGTVIKMQSEVQDLIDRINKHKTKMSKGQKAISEYIIKNYDKAAFMTAAKLGKTVGVSESTVSRYAVQLGYDGYPELQKAFQGLIKNKLTTIQRMELSSEQGGADILKNVLKADINNIKSTLENIDSTAFERVVRKICSAENVYLMGVRSAATTVEFMGYYLNFLLDNVHVITSGINDIVEQLSHIKNGDILIAFSFPRYARRAVDGAEYAKKCGASITVITDSEYSPLVPFADDVLYAKSDMASFVDSLVAPLSLVNALLIAVSTENKNQAVNNFRNLENIWHQYGVYTEKDDKDN